MAIGLKEGMGPGGGGRIPAEVVKALKRNSSSLLIKGMAGTGKTTLALTILRTFNLRNDFLYLSTRASPSQVINDHPWLKDWLGNGDEAEKEARDPYLAPLFVDARLDEPSQLFEKITNQLMDARSPLIVVDAWDSLKELAKGEPLEADMRVLLAWCERAHAKLIVTGEDPRDVSLDALMDGVVVLSQKDREGGRLRELSLPKLRGIEIASPSYLFTLKGSIFRSFEQYRPEDCVAASSFSARRTRPKLLQGRYSTGFPELDSSLEGGIRAGSLVGLRLSPDVDPRAALILTGNIIAEFVRANRKIVIGSIDGIDERLMDGLLKGLIPRGKLKYVRHVPATKRDGESGEPPETVGEESALVKALEESEEPTLSILGARIVGQRRNARGLPLENLAKATRQSAGLGFIVSRGTERRTSEDLDGSVSIRMKVSSVNGTLVLQPGSMVSKLLAFDISRESGTPILGLESIE